MKTCSAPCLLGLVLLGAMLGTTVAVAQPSPVTAQSEATHPITQHKNLGPVQLTLAADRRTLGIADRLRLTLTIEAPPDIAVTFQQTDETLGPFRVLNQTALGPLTTTSQTQKWQREYLLEAERAGDLAIPPLTVSFRDATAVSNTACVYFQNCSPSERAAAAASQQQLSTDPFTVAVTSVVPEDADITAFKDIAPPVALKPPSAPAVSAWLWLAAAAMAFFGFAAIGWWLQRRRSLASAPPRPAHELALAALQRLQNQNLISQRRIEEFYVKLSAILRRYVAWRFEVRAPEQTTEEFLTAVGTSGGAIAARRDLLSAFLQHCDLVKFARYQPSSSDMQKALENAIAFVEQTADGQVLVAAASGVETL